MSGRGRNNNNSPRVSRKRLRNNSRTLTRKKAKLDKPFGIVNKSNEETKGLLTTLVLGDAKHDFQGEEGIDFTLINKMILEFLPSDETLIDVRSIDEPKLFKLVTDEDLYDVINNSLMNTTQLNIKNNREYIVNTINTTTMNDSSVLLNFLKSNNPTNKDFTFFIDTDNNHILDIVKRGSLNNEGHIYLVENRESISDPGGKTTELTKPGLFKKVSGIPLTIIRDKEVSNIVYSSYNVDDSDILNDFYSNFDITLGPIDNLFYEIKDPNNPRYNKKITDDIKKENSISSTVEYIKQQLRGNNKFEIVQPFFRKRSGDWFQALASLQSNRNYEPTTTKGVNIVITIDRALLAYCLFVGANVIYSDGKKKQITYFYNSSEQKQLNPRDSLKLFFSNDGNARVANAFTFQRTFLTFVESHNKNIIDRLTAIEITIRNSALNLSLPTHIKEFNKLYLRYNVFLIQKILFNKKTSNYVKVYGGFLRRYLRIDGPIEELEKLRMFVIATESLQKEYTNDTQSFMENYLDSLRNEYKTLMQSKNLEYLEFNPKIDETIFNEIETSVFEYINIIAYFKFLKEADFVYTKKLIDALYIHNGKTLLKAFITKIVPMFSDEQIGGKTPLRTMKTLKAYNTARHTRNKRKSVKAVNHQLEYNRRLLENLDNNYYTLCLTNIEKQIKDYQLYSITNYFKFYTYENKLVTDYFVNTLYYIYKDLQDYFDTEEGKNNVELADRFVICIIESLSANKIIEKEPVLEFFTAQPKNIETIMTNINSADLDLQDNLLEVMRNFLTPETYKLYAERF